MLPTDNPLLAAAALLPPALLFGLSASPGAELLASAAVVVPEMPAPLSDSPAATAFVLPTRPGETLPDAPAVATVASPVAAPLAEAAVDGSALDAALETAPLETVAARARPFVATPTSRAAEPTLATIIGAGAFTEAAASV